MNIFIFGIILLIISIILYFNFEKKGMVYTKSDIDNEYYLVRDVPNKQHASNMLARIKENIIKLSTYLYLNKSDKNNAVYSEYIDRLYSRAPNIILVESDADSIHTSYSVNKGEQIVFCLRSKNFDGMHTINLIMYVVLHEISHVACPIYDNHGPLFRKIFTFITNTAIFLKMYTKIPFYEEPTEYCGLTITDSIV